MAFGLIFYILLNLEEIKKERIPSFYYFDIINVLNFGCLRISFINFLTDGAKELPILLDAVKEFIPNLTSLYDLNFSTFSAETR